MKNRFSKYMSGNINADELQSFQNDLESMSDEELNKYLEEYDTKIDFDSDDIDELQKKLNDDIHRNKHHLLILRIVASCAAVMLPLLVVCAIILINNHSEIEQYRSIISQQVKIETVSGEFVKTVLPDGSKVSMSPESMLSYSLSSFNSKERRIKYSGEGSFKIAHIENAPFILYASYFEIKVLGTEFSLFSRVDRDQSEIYLEKGSIQLTSLITNNSEILAPGEYAIISKNNGSIRLLKEDDKFLSVGKNTIYFTSTSFSKISTELERYYGYQVIQNSNVKDLIFTGSIPTNNLEEATFILGSTLNLNFDIDKENRTIMIRL